MRRRWTVLVAVALLVAVGVLAWTVIRDLTSDCAAGQERVKGICVRVK